MSPDRKVSRPENLNASALDSESEDEEEEEEEGEDEEGEVDDGGGGEEGLSSDVAWKIWVLIVYIPFGYCTE